MTKGFVRLSIRTVIRRLLVSTSAIASFAGTAATAATLSTFAGTFVAGNGDPRFVSNDYSENVDSTDSPTINLSAADSSGVTTASGSVSGNAVTGELKLKAASDGNRDVPPAPMSGNRFGTIRTGVAIEEIYQVTGSGQMSVSMLVDGSWGFTNPDFSTHELPLWNLIANVGIGRLGAGSFSDSVCLGTSCTPSINQSAFGSLDGYFIKATMVVDTRGTTQSIRVNSQLSSNIGFADGSLDFGNTAKFFVDFDQGLTVNAADPNFLSDPAFLKEISAVPLPASGLLILAGLAALGGVRARS